MSGMGDSELKAGHPPAVKVGSMRITQHTHKKTDETDEEVLPSGSPPKEHKLVISGVVTKGDADFPPSAIKAYHEKPIPSHEYRSVVNKPNIIHQPKK